MKNKEYYNLEELAFIFSDEDERVYVEKKGVCVLKTKKKCMMYDFAEWLEEEYTRELTADEKVILRNAHSKYKWILRYDGVVSLSENEPEMDEWGVMTKVEDIEPFDHLFQFICNGEAYEIKELLDE